MRTVGVSPKFYAAIAMAILGYLATQQLVDFPTLADLLIQVGLVGGGVAIAGPGAVEPKPPADERGYSLVEALLVVFLALVVLLLLLAVLGRV
jgi:hypothetical protein